MNTENSIKIQIFFRFSRRLRTVGFPFLLDVAFWAESFPADCFNIL